MPEEMNENTDTLNLGEVIQLSGFRDLDRATMVVVKKMVGSYARKFSDSVEGFEKLQIDLKMIHENESSHKGTFNIVAKALVKGNSVNSEVEDHNLFVGLDSALKKIESQLRK